MDTSNTAQPASSNTAPADIDIDDFEDKESGVVTIKDPTTGAPTRFAITLAGPEHPTRKRITMNKQRRMRAALSKTGKLQLDSPEDDEAEQLTTLVECTLDWTGLVRSGTPVPFSKAEARKLFEDPKRRWLRDQVQAAMDDREAFIARSATS